MLRSVFYYLFCSVLFTNNCFAQSVHQINVTGDLSFRGLSVVNDSVVWVSGSKGTVGKSVDSGKTWQWKSVKGYLKNDFRDIEAFSENVAIIMSVADPTYILKTINGGKSWKKVYENKTKGMFLDAMEFEDEQNGYIVGDPINGTFFIAKTIDGGKSWHDMDTKFCAVADSAEACFASSGTNIRMINKNKFAFVSGGRTSNLISETKKVKLPILQGKETQGANSIAIKDSLNFIIVGGDFLDVTAKPNCVITHDGGKSWKQAMQPPEGYRSCVEYLFGDTWICCGLTGVDISLDNGDTWRQISKESYHTCRKAKSGKAVYFSGAKSAIGKLVFD